MVVIKNADGFFVGPSVDGVVAVMSAAVRKCRAAHEQAGKMIAERENGLVILADVE